MHAVAHERDRSWARPHRQRGLGPFEPAAHAPDEAEAAVAAKLVSSTTSNHQSRQRAALVPMLGAVTCCARGAPRAEGRVSCP
jgi:hypothetical protein